ncbi:MAG: DUF1697 domain-containing protein [Verrucomicrobia bacterium]|nr:DUF1697 domain-containing protein [Verrucomicrobiota bacterium]MDA1067989.1 DUF1697 domain-containing protein [Verrucomicrobiota bacterium]
MSKFIALLRGINVSGKNKIRMVELKALFETLGYEEVTTYLQSGNVVFNAKKKPNSSQIEKTIFDQLGPTVPVLILSQSQLDQVFSNNPFLTKGSTDPAHCYVTFLWEARSEKETQAIASPANETGSFECRDALVYVICPDGYGKTKINNQFFEKKLKVIATTRNWKTVTTLLTLVNEG